MDESKYSWIDKTYISRCLNKDVGQIKKYNTAYAVGKGNNYASTLLRVTVDLEDEKINEDDQPSERFLIKCLPSGLMGKLIQDAGMWDKELFMYMNVLPVIESYVGCLIGPKCLNNFSDFLKDSINKEIVLEDLTSTFKMADRREQLDYEHCVIVMKKLAKFHAGSVAVRKTHKEYIETVGEELCFRDTRKETNELYFRQPFKNLAEHIKDNSDLRQYSKGLKNFGERFWELALKAVKPKTFNVLNHGDLWTNNILFEYDNTGKVIDSRLIDFQCCRYTTPAFDLQYFFMSSVQENLRQTKLHDLINIYTNNLNCELVRLGENPISIENLYNDLLITDCYGLYASIFVLPISIREPESISDNDDILNTEADNTFVKCIQSKKYQNMLPNILAYYQDKGLFEDSYDNSERKNFFRLLDENEISSISL